MAAQHELDHAGVARWGAPDSSVLYSLGKQTDSGGVKKKKKKKNLFSTSSQITCNVIITN